MQDHGVRGNQLFALQAVDDEVRRLGKVQIGELGADHIEPLDRADVVVLVMADQDLLGNSLDGFGIEGQRLGLIGDGFSSFRWFALRRCRSGQTRRGCGAREQTCALDEASAFQFGVHRRSPGLAIEMAASAPNSLKMPDASVVITVQTPVGTMCRGRRT